MRVMSCPAAPRAALQGARQLQAPRAVRMPAPIPRARSVSLRVQAMKTWPNPEFIAETKAAFPGKSIASVEEARVLFSAAGYTYLDVRTPLEIDEAGKVRGSVNIPFLNEKKSFDSEKGEKVVTRDPNPDWIKQVEKRFADKDTPLLIGCTNGRQYTIDAMQALTEAGYTNLVAIRGGFEGWNAVFDGKLQRRKQFQPAGALGDGSGAPQPDVVKEQMMRLRRAEQELDNGVQKLESEVKAARAALERAMERTLEGQAEQAAALAKAKDEQVRKHQELLSNLLDCTTRLAAARARAAAAEMEVREIEGDLAVLTEEVAAFMAKARGSQGELGGGSQAAPERLLEA